MKKKPAMNVRPLDEVMRKYVLRALEACRWNKRAAAEKLGICSKTLYNWLNEWEEKGLIVRPATGREWAVEPGKVVPR